MAVIAVDAGTTMIKAVGYDDDGSESIVVRQPTVVHRPQPGWAEQDMSAVWDAVAFAIGQVRRRLTSDVEYLVLTGQGDGCWLVGPDGEPTGPAILWNDARAATLVERWAAEGRLQKAFSINGSQMFPGLPNAILTWLREADPARLERSSHALTCGGWLYSCLTGVSAIDESDAAVPFMDITSRTYSEDLIELFDMQWGRRFLPPILSGSGRVSPLLETAAWRTGLPTGLPVVLSSYDIASTSIGVGAVEPGSACTVLGTTLCTEIVSSSARTSGAPTGLTVPLGVEDRYLSAFPTLAGTDVFQWACSMLAVDGPEELAGLAARSPRGAAGVTFLPYLSPAGERAPFFDTAARGSFTGLTFEHGREDLARAVFEGLTFVIRECLEASGVRPADLRVCGGGAANEFWVQLIADVTGVPVLRSVDTEVGARGAFLLGAVAAGRAPDIKGVSERYVRTRDTFTPEAGNAAFYESAYQGFLAVRDAVSAAWHLAGGAAAQPGRPVEVRGPATPAAQSEDTA